MFKKLLTFLGLDSVQVKDGKATFELTEEQMEASGKIISERDDLVASVAKLQAELEEERQQNTTAQAELATANEKVVTLEKEIADLKAENTELKGEAGAESIQGSQATDGKGEQKVEFDHDGDINTEVAKAIELFY